MATTVKLLTEWNGYPHNAIITLDDGTATGLVAGKIATTTTAGGVVYVPPDQPAYTVPMVAEFDPDTPSALPALKARGQTVFSAAKVAAIDAVVSGAGILANIVSVGPARVAVVGASITGASASSGPTKTYTWIAGLSTSGLKAEFPFAVYSYPGQPTEVIYPHVADAIADGASVVVLGPDYGTNATDETVTLGVEAAYGQYVREALKDCKRAGVTMIACTTIPRGAGAGAEYHQGAAIQNMWLTAMGQRLGFKVIDTARIATDPATGYMYASWLNVGDDVHPVDAGHAAIGAAVAAGLNATLSDMACPVTVAGGKVANPLMTGAGPQPTGWATRTPPTIGTVTKSIGASLGEADLPAGRWFKIECPSATGGQAINGQAAAITVVPGEVLAAFAYGKAEGAGVVTIEVVNTANNATISTVLSPANGASSSGAWRRFAVPSGVTEVALVMRQVATSGQVTTGYIGAAQVWSLTQLGLA